MIQLFQEIKGLWQYDLRAKNVRLSLPISHWVQIWKLNRLFCFPLSLLEQNLLDLKYHGVIFTQNSSPPPITVEEDIFSKCSDLLASSVALSDSATAGSLQVGTFTKIVISRCNFSKWKKILIICFLFFSNFSAQINQGNFLICFRFFQKKRIFKQ